MAGAMVRGLGAALLMCCLSCCCLAVDYTVGDSSGWTTTYDYSTWTGAKTFAVGDTLRFNYARGAHNVAEVSSGDYGSCSAANTLFLDNSGSTTITLKTAGTHYFICGVLGHCAGGMKLAVTVGAGATPSTVPSPPAPPSTVTPTPPVTTGTPSACGKLAPPSAVALAGLALLKCALF